MPSVRVCECPCSSVKPSSGQRIPQPKLFARHSPHEIPQHKQGMPHKLSTPPCEAPFERGKGRETPPLFKITPDSPYQMPQPAAILQHKEATKPHSLSLLPHHIGKTTTQGRIVPPFRAKMRYLFHTELPEEEGIPHEELSLRFSGSLPSDQACYNPRLEAFLPQ